jgi:hypothetical protein
MHTIVDGQTRLVLAHNIIHLLLLHVCALVVRLVQDELIWASPTLERIDVVRVLDRPGNECDGQAVAAIWTNYNRLARLNS